MPRSLSTLERILICFLSTSNSFDKKAADVLTDILAHREVCVPIYTNPKM